MLSELKQDLINKVSITKDEDLLMLLKKEYEYFSGESNENVTDRLSVTDKEELINMVNEPFGFNTLNQKEFDEAIKNRKPF